MKFSIFTKPLTVSRRGKSRVVDNKADGNAKSRRSSATLQLIQSQAENGEPIARLTTERFGSASDRAKAAAHASATLAVEEYAPDNGLSSVLENAALLHAGGQTDVALSLLIGALSSDSEARRLPRTWHALFDLLQRTGDRTAFEKLALEYVIAFEASPPPWIEPDRASQKGAQRVAAGYFAVSQINIKTALEILARVAKFASLKIDVATISQFEDTGCRRVVDVLRRLRRQGYPLVWQGMETLERQIAQKTKVGERSNEGIWLLDLELIQWQNNAARFDERAVDFAVTFEVSPPSWEPLVTPLVATRAAALASAKSSLSIADDRAAAGNANDALVLRGILAGSADAQIASLAGLASGRNWVAIDMKQVDRIDFVCAGALQNFVSGFETAGKRVQIIGASAIIEALLLLIGVESRAFQTR